MTALLIEMTSWLIAAMILGLVVAWLLAKIVYERKHQREEDSLSALILERNNMIEKLEKTIRKHKIISTKTSDDLEDMEKAYAHKASELTSLQSRERNSSLLLEMTKLKDIDAKRLKELQGFEEVLVKSEDKLQEKEVEYKNLLKNFDKNVEEARVNEEKIAELEENLKLYKASSSDAEFIISKDQFVKIEEQLAQYQKEISILNNEKQELLKKLKQSSPKEQSSEENLENKAIEALKKESDDSSMVKVFKETYKKITKS